MSCRGLWGSSSDALLCVYRRHEALEETALYRSTQDPFVFPVVVAPACVMACSCVEVAAGANEAGALSRSSRGIAAVLLRNAARGMV